jgi:putative phosphoesterase
MKIGVLADTHVPNKDTMLPAAVLDAVRGMDIILHAGDVGGIEILQQLEPIAQTYAIYGEQDDAKVRKYLQEKQRLEFENRSIGLVHGNRALEGSLLTRLSFNMNKNARLQAVCTAVLQDYPDVDAIVFGHTHEPYMKMHGGVLLFNPGAAVLPSGKPGSIGVLEITNQAIKGRIIPL